MQSLQSMTYLVCAALGLLCAVTAPVSSSATGLRSDSAIRYSGRTEGSKAIVRQLLDSDSKATTFSKRKQVAPAQSLRELFQDMVDVADRVSVESRDHSTVALQLRAAFKLCPTCSAKNTVGKATQSIFHLDEYKDSIFMLQNILPHLFTDESIQNLLWVGVQPCTLRYEYVVREQGIDFTTIDLNPQMAMYGSSSRHIIGPIQSVYRHVEPGSFDVVMLNGVLGWGIKSDAHIKQAVKALHRVMRPNALLVIGYNAKLVDCCDQFLPIFRPVDLENSKQQNDMTESELHHVYKLYRTEADLYETRKAYISRAS